MRIPVTLSKDFTTVEDDQDRVIFKARRAVVRVPDRVLAPMPVVAVSCEWSATATSSPQALCTCQETVAVAAYVIDTVSQVNGQWSPL